MTYIEGAPTNGTATVGTSSTAILADNSAAKYRAIVNSGSNAVYLGFGAAAVVGKGVFIGPSGGVWEEKETRGSKVFRGAINGITETGTSVVTTVER